MFQRLRAGEAVTPEMWNTLTTFLEQLLQPSGGGNVQPEVSASGFTIRDYSDRPLWARLTSDRTDNCYGWEPVVVSADGTVTVTAEYDGVTGGDSDYVPAVAVGGETDLPAGAVVRIWPDYAGGFYAFQAGDSTGTGDGVFVHVTAVTGSAPYLYTVKPVQRNSGNTGWEEISGGATTTGVVEDQDRLLEVDSSTVTQAYELHTDASGRKWIELDQDAALTRKGFVNMSRQIFRGPKIVYGNSSDTGSDLPAFNLPIAFMAAPSEGDQYRSIACMFGAGGADDGTRLRLRGGNSTDTTYVDLFCDEDEALFSMVATASAYSAGIRVDPDKAQFTTDGTFARTDANGSYVGVTSATVRTGLPTTGAGPYGPHISLAHTIGAGATGAISYDPTIAGLAATVNFVVGNVLYDAGTKATNMIPAGTFGVVRDDSGVAVKLGADASVWVKAGSPDDPDSVKLPFWGGLYTGKSVTGPIDPP